MQDGHLVAMGAAKPMLPVTPLAAGNAAYIEDLYERYLADPDSVEPQWRDFFASLGGQGDVAHGPLIGELARRATNGGGAGRGARAAATATATPIEPGTAGAKQAAVSRLIQTYMNRGHLVADIDPLGLMMPPRQQILGPGLLRPVGRRSRPRVLHREPQRRDQAAPEAPRHLCAAQVHLQRHDRRRVRAHVGHDRAALAARPLPGRAHATAIRARGATEHPLAAHDGGGSRAVPCDEVSGAEALLARGWRQPDSRCSTT